MLGKRARPIRKTTSMSQLPPPGSCESAIKPRKPILCARSGYPSDFVPPFAPEESLTNEETSPDSNPVVLHAFLPVAANHDGSAKTESVIQNEMNSPSENHRGVLCQMFVEPNSRKNKVYVAMIEGREEQIRCYTEEGNADERINLVNSWEQQQILLASSPQFLRSVSLAASPAGFLDMCFYCRSRLAHGKDIYMYRGDTAFCSVECRQFQIAIDETKNSSMVAAISKQIVAPTIPFVSDHNKMVPRCTEAVVLHF